MGTAATILGILVLIASIAGTTYTNTQNRKLTKETQLDNYLYTDKLQENAQLRKEDFYNKYENPLALRTQLEQAGLNPGLMYQNGSGTIGSSGAASAPAVNQSAPTQYKYELDPLTAAQLRNIEADTKEKEANAGLLGAKTGETNANTNKINETIDLIKAQVKSTDAQTQLNKLQADYQEIINMYADTKESISVDTMIAKYNEITQSIKQLELNNEITTAQKEDLKKTANLQNRLILADIVLKGSQKQLNNVEKEKLGQDIQESAERVKKIKEETKLKIAETKTEAEKKTLYWQEARKVGREAAILNQKYKIYKEYGEIEQIVDIISDLAPDVSIVKGLK